MRVLTFAATCLSIAAVLTGTNALRAEEPPPGFDAWLAELREDAEKRNVSQEIFDLAFAGVELLPDVIEKDRNQPEFKLTFEEYKRRIVSSTRVERGREMMREHRALLQEIEAKYGVPGRFVVALWGVESNFGRTQGTYPIVSALTTLAYDGRRSAFFRKELLNALEIAEGRHIEPERMLASWAGAMGQPQFMPSSFLNFAVDHDGDGRRDIWHSTPDVLASAANYLSRSGWRESWIWGRAVQLPRDFDRALVGRDVKRNLSAWSDLGVRRADGSPLPTADVDASIVQPDGEGGEAFVVYKNFHVLLTWNRSDYFATAIGLIADRIAQ